MDYTRAMRWQRTHRKGTRQPVILHTQSGFWPAEAFLREDYWPYVEQCKADGVEPLSVRAYYEQIIAR